MRGRTMRSGIGCALERGRRATKGGSGMNAGPSVRLLVIGGTSLPVDVPDHPFPFLPIRARTTAIRAGSATSQSLQGRNSEHNRAHSCRAREETRESFGPFGKACEATAGDQVALSDKAPQS